MRERAIEGDSGSIYPAPLDRVEPGDTWYLFQDHDDVPRDAGVTITGNDWTVAPDDGLVSIGVASVDPEVEFRTRVAATFDPSTDGNLYTFTNHVTLSDGHSFRRKCSVPVVAVRDPTA